MFAPGKPFQPSLGLWARPGAYPRVEHLKGASLEKAPAIPSNTTLSWKGFQGIITLAYYEDL